MAQKLRMFRYLHGALDLETIESRPIFNGDQLKDLEADIKNRAKEIIEDFKITSDDVTARYLASKAFSSIRRVVPRPKCWNRIVELAAALGVKLPRECDAKSQGIILSIRESCRSSPLP